MFTAEELQMDWSSKSSRTKGTGPTINNFSKTISPTSNNNYYNNNNYNHNQINYNYNIPSPSIIPSTSPNVSSISNNHVSNPLMNESVPPPPPPPPYTETVENQNRPPPPPPPPPAYSSVNNNNQRSVQYVQSNSYNVNNVNGDNYYNNNIILSPSGCNNGVGFAASSPPPCCACGDCQCGSSLFCHCLKHAICAILYLGHCFGGNGGNC